MYILSVIFVFVLGLLLGFYPFFCFLGLMVYFFFFLRLSISSFWLEEKKKKVGGGVHLCMLKCNYIL